MTDPTDPPERPSAGRAYSLVWFLLAFVVYRGCAVGALEREELRGSWRPAEATVVSNRVGYGGLGDDRYYLHAVLATGEGPETRTSEKQVGSGPRPSVERLAAEDFAPGTRHAVFVDPADPGRLMFPEDAGRQYWAGVAGAGLFAALGLGVLLSRRRPPADPSPDRP